MRYFFLSGIRWQDAVDILLNSYILFRLYVLFRGTTAFRVLIGITLLWFSQKIIISLGLVLTSWVIQGVTAVAALVIIVVFRNEIRSVLQTQNLKALLWGYPRKTSAAPIEIITESVFELAEKRTGALIVVPGREDLGDIVRGGIDWNGLVSKEMIASIFWPDNPVHDGAAIVHNDRITRVGTLLPLSSRYDLPSFYGTRHRAAAGLAENTDALVIVVSEERGSIAVAQGTRLRRIKQKEELAALLQGHLAPPPVKKGVLYRDNLELLLAGIVSVLFIAGIWFTFARGADTLISLDLPIEYINRKPDIDIFDASANSVRVRLSGSSTMIQSMRPGQVLVRVDLSKKRIGHNIITLSEEMVLLPPGVTVRSLEPPVLEVTLDVPMQTSLPVQVDWVGTLPQDIIILQAKLTPAALSIRGGTQMLKKMPTIYTEPVVVDTISASGSLIAKPAVPDNIVVIAADAKSAIKVDYIVQPRSQP